MAVVEPSYTKLDPKLPDYINFLLCPEIKDLLDLQVKVGSGSKPEEIGAVKWMVIARSKVLRVMLLESKMKDSKEINITDLEPSTFRQFLTYSYGHDNVDSLPFEDSVKLLSAAEKYEVGDLKSRLAETITPQVTVENVPVILEHGPVCETVPLLWQETTNLIQTETKYLLEHPKFLTLKPEAVVHILQQDELSVEEVDVWRASLKWARHQLDGGVGPVSADVMRSTMLPLLKHTRLCTLSHAQLCEEVLPTDVVTLEEFKLICLAVKTGSKEAGLATVCNEIVSRERGIDRVIEIDIDSLCPPMVRKSSYCSKYVIQTTRKVKNISLVLLPRSLNGSETYECNATVEITRLTDHDNMTSIESPRVVTFTEQVPDDQPVVMPLTDDQGHIQLESGTEYVVWIDFNCCHQALVGNSKAGLLLVSNSDLTLKAPRDRGDSVWSNLKALKYTV